MGIRRSSLMGAKLKANDKELKYKIKTRYGHLPVYEEKEKPKPNKPTYAQIAEWRKILHRLSYFLRSVDYLLLELLRRLVITATRHLLKFVKQSYNAGLEIDEEVCATYSAVFVYTYMIVYVACIWWIVVHFAFLFCIL